MPHPFASTILEAAPESPEAAAPAVAGGPSNQQILDAAKSAYAAYQSVVDAVTLAVVASIQDPSLGPDLRALDGTDWSARTTPEITAPFFASREIATALGVVTRTLDVRTLFVGAFANTARGSGPGVVGYARDLAATGDPSGLLVALDLFKGVVTVDPGRNLQYGVWLRTPSELHDSVLGMYVNARVQGITVNLKVLLTSTLSPYGFMSSTGAEVPVNSGVFSGTTSRWA